MNQNPFSNLNEAKTSLAFHVIWYDKDSDLERKFTLTFYKEDHAVEMFDLKLKRPFLRRIHCNSFEEKDLFVGNTIVVFSRRLQIIDYANDATKHKIQQNHDVTFAMIKSDGIDKLGKMISAIEEAGFSIGRAKLTQLSVEQASRFYEEHEERDFFGDLLSYITSGPVLAIELFRADAVKQWRKVLGPTDSNKARDTVPNSIRARFGKDKTYNAAHGSDSKESVKRELEFFFSEDSKEKEFVPKAISNQSNTTCCVIKPHAVKAGVVGKIIDQIQQNNFLISGLKSFHLKYEHAEEFYEIYKGLVQDYTGMVKQLSSGRCVVLEISHPNFINEVVQEFRQLVGPSDPELARALRPKSLRAKFGGKTMEKNAVHCTDLPEDSQLEIEYFFKILN